MNNMQSRKDGETEFRSQSQSECQARDRLRIIILETLEEQDEI